MATVKPFKAIRPDAKYADKVISLPYDVMNRKEAAEMAADNPYSFIEQNLSCGQLILWQSRLAITAVLTTAALTLALSAALPNRYMALAASAGLLFLPLLVSPSPERPLYTLWMLAPAYQLLSNHLLALGTFSLGGRSLLWAWWALPASLLAVGAGLCGAKRAFGGREVR